MDAKNVSETAALKKEEEDEPKLVTSPGFLSVDKRVVFEQVSKDNYIIYDLAEGKFQVTTAGPTRQYYDPAADVRYAPLPRVPWPLAKPNVHFVLDDAKGSLWQDTKDFIEEHVELLDPELYDVLAAWVHATYIPELWTVVPYIYIFGPVASGKTRLLEVLQQLCYRGIIGSNVSAAALFRGVQEWHPTVFLDETEILNKAEHMEIVGLLNSGYRRGQYAWRVKMTEQGSELELFDVFGFKGLSGTQGLAKALESRSIMVRMIKNIRPVRFLLNKESAEELRSRLLMWRLLMLRKAYGEGCEGCEPFLEVPYGLEFADGRLTELFQPLLAVTNDGHDNIIKYAKKVHEIRQLEETVGLEATILEAVDKASLNAKENIILTKDIADTLNEELSDKDRFKQATVGRVMRKIGFLPRHTRKGNGWFLDPDRLKLLKAWYLPEPTTPENHSHGSHHSQAVKDYALKAPKLDRLTKQYKGEWTGECVVCKTRGEMDWQVTELDGCQGLVCGPCGEELEKELQKV